jgi:hypothetical protein
MLLLLIIGILLLRSCGLMMPFRPDRVTIETTAGKVLAERTNPRASFAGHDLDTKWDPLQRLQIWIDFSNISYS